MLIFSRKVLLSLSVLTALGWGINVLGGCTEYENSRVTHFPGDEVACAGTGSGCRECSSSSGQVTCWENEPFGNCLFIETPPS